MAERVLMEGDVYHDLATIRRGRGFTQAQVAATLNVTQSAISKFERKWRSGQSNVSVIWLYSYCNAIGGELKFDILDKEEATHEHAP